MALDKLVDSAQLDAALTYEAGKIRAKLGSSAQISFDLANQKGFGDVIDAIPSGGSYTEEDILLGNALTGDKTFAATADIGSSAIIGQHGISKLTVDLNGKTFSASGSNLAKNGVSCYVIKGDITPYAPEFFATGDGSKDFIIVIQGHVPRYRQYSLRDTRLTLADLTYDGTGSNQGLDADAAYGSHKLATIIIRGTAVLPLKNVSALTTNNAWKNGGTGGTLYVPRSLKSTYESASNWSTVLGYSNNQILAIEDSIYKDQYADGTPIS